MKTDSQIAREAAQYIRENGFSPEYRVGNSKCGCFTHAIEEVGDYFTPNLYTALLLVIGCDIYEPDLSRNGWTRSVESTADAAAALDIVADLLA